MKNSQVSIDASFLLKLFLPEEKSEKAEEIWKSWIKDSIEVVAPTLIIFEVSSVLRNKVYRGSIDAETGANIINQLKGLDILLVYTDDILDIAWEIGDILKSSTLYDCFYIALARFLDIPLWTADKRLYDSAKNIVPFINLL
ncbi:MAG: type II toxin-antitoxin system VapC family toxin [Nitrospirota bacterium]|nr:type II toxin-antitoxin system VapC family toxin [Nitrospirota bacterium]